MARPAVIFSGGNPLPRSPRDLIAPDAFVVAADAGLHAARQLGIRVDLLVGDLDSAEPTSVSAAEAAGTVIEAHPADKDATDLELALLATSLRGLAPVRVIGGSSLDRIDHFLANALLLAAERFAPLSLDWWVEDARVVVVRDTATLTGSEGDIVTILAVGGPVLGINTEGLRWRLAGGALEPGSTRGVSNLMTSTRAAVTVARGTALVIHTGSPTP